MASLMCTGNEEEKWHTLTREVATVGKVVGREVVPVGMEVARRHGQG